jgi:hypothetical protein
MFKLYRSRQHEGSWIAYTQETGWVVFPAEAGGWEKRRPCRGLDPVHLRQVPADLAANTGVSLTYLPPRAA